VGGQLTYTIGVENLGPDPATGVSVSDNLPNGVDLVSATGPSGACAAQGGKLTCPIGALSPVGINYGGSPANVTVVVAPRKPGTIRNTATVKGDQKDPANANNKAVASTRVLGAVVCRGVPATISGTSGDDALVGTPGPDVIAALGGGGGPRLRRERPRSATGERRPGPPRGLRRQRRAEGRAGRRSAARRSRLRPLPRRRERGLDQKLRAIGSLRPHGARQVVTRSSRAAARSGLSAFAAFRPSTGRRRGSDRQRPGR
jgi:uncharacterized repeat protein (TIGR01451 family)